MFTSRVPATAKRPVRAVLRPSHPGPSLVPSPGGQLGAASPAASGSEAALSCPRDQDGKGGHLAGSVSCGVSPAHSLGRAKATPVTTGARVRSRVGRPRPRRCPGPGLLLVQAPAQSWGPGSPARPAPGMEVRATAGGDTSAGAGGGGRTTHQTHTGPAGNAPGTASAGTRPPAAAHRPDPQILSTLTAAGIGKYQGPQAPPCRPPSLSPASPGGPDSSRSPASPAQRKGRQA